MRCIALVCLTVFVVGLTATFSTQVAQATFGDVEGTPYEHAVDSLASLVKDGRGVITGDPSGNFRPNDYITRAEVTAILTRAFGFEQFARLLRGHSQFTDVSGAHWASGYIALAASKRWVNGVGGGMFSADAHVTSDQWVAMLVRALGYEGEAMAKGAWPSGYRDAATRLGIIRPGDATGGLPATRGEVALMAYRAVFSVPPRGSSVPLARSVFGAQNQTDAMWIEADATSVPVNTMVHLQAILRDGDGRPVNDSQVIWDTNLGLIDRQGAFISTTPGQATITARYGRLEASVGITVYGEPHGVELSGPETVVANAASEYEIKGYLVDKGGNRVAREGIALYLEHKDSNNAAVIVDGAALTDETGSVSFTIRSTMSPDRQDLLMATGGDLEEGVHLVESVDQVATAISLEAGQVLLPVNSAATTTVSARIIDQAGEPMLHGVYELTFHLSGKATWSNLSVTDRSAFIIGGDAVAETVRTVVGEPGPVIVTVTAPGFSPAVVKMEGLIAGEPRQLDVRAINTEISAAGHASGNVEEEVRVNVTVMDRNGVPVPAVEDIPLKLEYDRDRLSLHTTEDTSPGQVGSISIAAGMKETTFFMTGEDVGIWLFHVSDASERLRGGGSFGVSILPAEAVALVVTPSKETFITSSTPVTIEAFFSDAFGNRVPRAGEEVELQVINDSCVGKGRINGEEQITLTTDNSGRVSAVFSAQQYPGDSYTVEVACGNLRADTGPLTVISFPAASLELETRDLSTGHLVGTVSSNYDEAVSIVAELRDSNGLLMSEDLTGRGFSAGLDFQVIAGGGEMVEEADGTAVVTEIEPGRYHATFLPGKQGTSVIRAIFDGQVSPVSSTISLRVRSGLPAKFSCYNQLRNQDPVHYTREGVFGPYVIELQDWGGNPVPNSLGEDITLSTTALRSLIGFTRPEVRLSPEGISSQTLTFAEGESAVTFWLEVKDHSEQVLIPGYWLLEDE